MPAALISGCSSGIGLETAKLFARRGYRVYAGARDPESARPLQEASAELPGLLVARLDVDRDDSVRDAVQRVLESEGGIDVVVNNAGVGLAGAIEHVPLDKARAMFETNFFGAARMMQAVIPSMRERRAGAIVNVTSIMGRLTQACHGFYSASKHALAALSEAAAAELKPFGVRVAIVEPGVVLTPIWGKGGIEMPAGHEYKTPLGRLLHLFDAQCDGGTTPDIVARVIVEAAGTGSPRLHYLVGEDALAMMKGRDSLTPEEWIGWQAEPDTGTFLGRAEALFEADLFHKPSLHRRRGKPRAGV